MSILTHDGEEQACGSIHTGNPNCVLCRYRVSNNLPLNPKEPDPNEITYGFLYQQGFKMSSCSEIIEFEKENQEANIGLRVYLGGEKARCEIYNTITFFTTNNDCIRDIPNVQTKKDVEDIIRLFGI